MNPRKHCFACMARLPGGLCDAGNDPAQCQAHTARGRVACRLCAFWRRHDKRHGAFTMGHCSRLWRDTWCGGYPQICPHFQAKGN